MNLENEFVSLDLAKKLLTLGIKQESLFYWYYAMHDGKNASWKPIYGISGLMHDRYSAFTSGELMKLLPACIDTKTDEPFNFFWLSIKKRSVKNIQYIATYVCDTVQCDKIDNNLYEITHPYFKAHDEKLSDCLAKMLIALIEEKKYA